MRNCFLKITANKNNDINSREIFNITKKWQSKLVRVLSEGFNTHIALKKDQAQIFKQLTQ